MKNTYPRVALSHDWLNGMRGGEKCLEVLCELYPESDIYTLFHEKGRVNGRIASHAIRVTGLQRFPDVFRRYRYYLPFFPRAIETFDVKNADLVVSTSHCVAKGIRSNGAVHVCYCFTPMRYAWGLFEEYFGKRNPAVKSLIRVALEKIKEWDRKTSARVDHFIAISEHIRRRIRRVYDRESEVIYPPVDTDFFTPDAAVPREDFYLAVSALVPYKRVDLAVEAFSRSGRKLVVIGDGPERARLEKTAGPSVRFLGWRPDVELRDFYRRARALVFPGEEDFGIVPVEMQACGGAVIAYAKGGALETVLADRTGVFFDEPAAESLARAVERFEACSADPGAARRNAERFGRERFKTEMRSALARILAEKRKRS